MMLDVEVLFVYDQTGKLLVMHILCQLFRFGALELLPVRSRRVLLNDGDISERTSNYRKAFLELEGDPPSKRSHELPSGKPHESSSSDVP
jgi:hypothetical protein